MTTSIDRRQSHQRTGDLIVSAALTAVFAVALIMALQEASRADIFPITVSALGTALALWSLVHTWFARTHETGGSASADEEHESESDDYIFTTATGQAWLQALGYLLGFIAVLYLLGIYVAVLVFTVLYLRLQAGRSWLFGAIYSVILCAFIYVIFTAALSVPVPSGAILS